jgi:hypothetical protein
MARIVPWVTPAAWAISRSGRPRRVARDGLMVLDLHLARLLCRCGPPASALRHEGCCESCPFHRLPRERFPRVSGLPPSHRMPPALMRRQRRALLRRLGRSRLLDARLQLPRLPATHLPASGDRPVLRTTSEYPNGVVQPMRGNVHVQYVPGRGARPTPARSSNSRRSGSPKLTSGCVVTDTDFVPQGHQARVRPGGTVLGRVDSRSEFRLITRRPGGSSMSLTPGSITDRYAWHAAIRICRIAPSILFGDVERALHQPAAPPTHRSRTPGYGKPLTD